MKTGWYWKIIIKCHQNRSKISTTSKILSMAVCLDVCKQKQLLHYLNFFFLYHLYIYFISRYFKHIISYVFYANGALIWPQITNVGMIYRSVRGSRNNTEFVVFKRICLAMCIEPKQNSLQTVSIILVSENIANNTRKTIYFI